MKKFLISICLLFSVIIVSAQSQSDLDKAMKQMQEMMKTMTPEEQEMVKQYTKGLPTSVEEMKNAKPSAQTYGQEANKVSDIGKKTTKIIGPEGGEIKSANGKIALKFPAGAVAKKTEISIEEIEGFSATSNGNAFQLLPEGIEFIEPVTLILKYTDEEIEGSKEDDLFITTRGKSNELLISLLTEVDTIANTITTEIKHFSKWGLASSIKADLIPNERHLSKGQSVDLSVEITRIIPADLEKKEALLKEYIKKIKESRNPTATEFEIVRLQNLSEKLKLSYLFTIHKFRMAFNSMQKEIRLKKEKNKLEEQQLKAEIDKIKAEIGMPIDDILAVLQEKKTVESTMYSVESWKLNNSNAPVSNSFGSLTPNGFNAKYIAPKIVSSNNKNVKVTVTLLLKDNSNIKQKLKLSSNITLTDEYYLNYTFDGKTTNTLQFAISPTFIKNMQQNAEKVMEQPISQCFLVDDELIIGTMSKLNLAENLNTTDVVYFKIKNPTKGQNLIKCDDESSSFRNDTRISVQTGVKDEHFVNSQNLRWWSGNMCDGKDNCVPFEFNITEYNPVNGGIVSGSFTGKVYEDKDMAKKCSNSIEHFISGEFSLAIQITPEDETEIMLPASKPTTTNSSTKPKSKTPPPPPPPLTPEEIVKMDGTPPKAPPPLTPEEIAKMDGTPPKAPPPLTPEEIAKMDGTPPKAPPPLTPEEIAKMDGTPPKAPPPLTPAEIAKMDGTPPKAPPPLTPAEIAKMDGTPPKAPPPLTPAEIAKMDGTNSSSAKSGATAVNTSSSPSNSKTISLKNGTAGVGTAPKSNAGAGNAGSTPKSNEGAGNASSTPKSNASAGNAGSTPKYTEGTGNASSTPKSNAGAGNAGSTPKSKEGAGNASTTPKSIEGAGNAGSTSKSNEGAGNASSTPKSNASAGNAGSTPKYTEGTGNASSTPKSIAGAGNAGSTSKSNEGAGNAGSTPKSNAGAGNAGSTPKSTTGAGNASSTPKSNEGSAGAVGTGNTIPPKSTASAYKMPCTAASIAQIPFDCPQRSNMSKYYGNSKTEVKANTEDMYKKLLNIGVLLTDAFKNTKGMIGSWETYVKDINEEGLQTGYLELDIQPLECKSNGEYSKSTGNPTIKIHFYINSFDDRVIKSNRKADGFIVTDDKTKDYFDGHLLYLIGEKQYDESFKGFPMYYKGFNNLDQAAVIITKPEIPLFKPISIAQFLELFRKWTSEYNNIWKGESSSVSNKDIDAFISKNSKEYLEKPCITTWNRSVQSPFLGRNAYADDATMGNPWVYINPEYIKMSSSTSIQYIMIKWSYGGDALTTQALKDFKSKFDFKKLQGMLGQ